MARGQTAAAGDQGVSKRPPGHGSALERAQPSGHLGRMTYEEFWPRYLRQHSRPATRRLHVLGTSLALLLLAGALLNGAWWLALAALVVGYGAAWLSHAFVERNRPETFSRPLWSLLSDLRMTWLYLTGGLRAELRKHGID